MRGFTSHRRLLRGQKSGFSGPFVHRARLLRDVLPAPAAGTDRIGMSMALPSSPPSPIHARPLMVLSQRSRRDEVS